MKRLLRQQWRHVTQRRTLITGKVRTWATGCWATIFHIFKPGTIWPMTFLAHSKNELIQWRGVRRLSVCKLLRKSLLLAGKWPDRHQTCTRWTPGQHASRVCSRARSKVTWYAHFLGFLEWGYELLRHWRSGLISTSPLFSAFYLLP